MAGTRQVYTTFAEFYAEPANNPFGVVEDDLEVCTRAVLEVFRDEGLPLNEAELLQNIQADLCRPISRFGVFVPDEIVSQGGPTSIARNPVISGHPRADSRLPEDLHFQRRRHVCGYGHHCI
jgi:hypothetical protein